MAGTKLAPGAVFVYAATGSDVEVTVIDGSEAVVTAANYGAYDKRIIAVYDCKGHADDSLDLQIGSNTEPYIFRQTTDFSTTAVTIPNMCPNWADDGPLIPSGTDLIGVVNGEWLIVCKAV